MRKYKFREWQASSIKKKCIGDCISRCSTVERLLGINLDTEYLNDQGVSVLDKLSYSKRDFDAGKLVPAEFDFKEGSNPVQRITDYRSAVKKYFLFCSMHLPSSDK